MVTGRPIRVLVVDDAIVVRRMVSDAVEAEPGLEVAGVAANGRVALRKIPLLQPDIVVLDVEMPELDGLETLRELRPLWPGLPVVMFSTLTERSARASLEALALGATDCVGKPVNTSDIRGAREVIRTQLVPKLLMLGAASINPWRTAAPRRPLSSASEPHAPTINLTPATSPLRGATAGATAYGRSGSLGSMSVSVVAIGSSTGGPNALVSLFADFPKDLGVPIVIVQHLPPVFTRVLAQRLSRAGPIPVAEASPGDQLVPGHALVAPGDWHMRVHRERTSVVVKTDQGPPENACRPSVDVLFRSVVEAYGAGVLTVVLTGMGRDGYQGCVSVRDAGGHVLVQDEGSSVIWGMPGQIAKGGLADEVLPLQGLATEIVRLVGRAGRAAPLAAMSAKDVHR